MSAYLFVVYSLDILVPNVKEFTSLKEDASSSKESDRYEDSPICL
jgi:hypothetical protein